MAKPRLPHGHWNQGCPPQAPESNNMFPCSYVAEVLAPAIRGFNGGVWQCRLTLSLQSERANRLKYFSFRVCGVLENECSLVAICVRYFLQRRTIHLVPWMGTSENIQAVQPQRCSDHMPSSLCVVSFRGSKAGRERGARAFLQGSYISLSVLLKNNLAISFARPREHIRAA